MTHKTVVHNASVTSGSLIESRHHALDLIRGLAALAVSQYHYMHWNGVAYIESMGTFAVYLFFALSGLTMMMVYAERFSGGATPEQVSSFFRNRFARLMPLLLLVAGLAFAKQLLAGEADIVAAILTGSGLMALQMPGFLSNTVGAWSLGIELTFYAVFPVIAILSRSWKPVATSLAVLFLAQHLFLWKIQGVENHWNYYISSLTFAPFFAIGILVSFDHGSRAKAMLPIALLAFAIIACFSLFISTNLMRDQVSYAILTVIAGCVVWAAWRSSMPRWLISPVTFLGDISYSLYLTHWIANDVTRLLQLPQLVQWGAYIGTAITGAYISYRLFELPVRDRLRAKTKP